MGGLLLMAAASTPLTTARAASPRADLEVAAGVVAATPTPRARLMPLSVSVNGTDRGSWVLLERDQLLYAPSEALSEWRLRRGETLPSIRHQGQQWYLLSALAGFNATLDPVNQSVDLTFAAHLFEATELGPSRSERPVASVSSSALFMNYDLSAAWSQFGEGLSTREAGALAEFGWSGPWGLLTHSVSALNVTNEPGAPRTFRRLETAFTRDYPEINASLRVGDTATRTGSWGRSVFFGGVQFGTNFALSPGFISSPIPVLTGSSSVPSTVELYINDALRQTSSVPAGPFTLQGQSGITGAGQARIVVRDLLGRETVLERDYFTHGEMLEEGLQDWSAEAGAVRRNLGLVNNDYGPLFGAGLWRYGVNQRLTIEARADYSAQGGGAAVTFVNALPWSLLGLVGIGARRYRGDGNGRQWLLGVEYASLHHSLGLRHESASVGLRQMGDEAEFETARRQTSANYSYASQGFGTFGVAYARVDSGLNGIFTSYSLNHALPLGRRSTLSWSLVAVNTNLPGQRGGVSLNVAVLIPLGGQFSAVASATHRRGSADAFVSANQGLASDVGWSWRTLAGRRDSEEYAEGGVAYQGTRGAVSAELSAASTRQALRFGATGSLVAIGGDWFASRRLMDSFALVEVPGYADIGVGFQGRVLARTDQQGRALVPSLQAHQTNTLWLDPNELPIGAELDSIEQLVVPARRSGVHVRFPVRSGRAALLRIDFDDGQPAPAGSVIVIDGDPQSFYVARRGEVFVTGLKPSNSLRLQWKDAVCEIDVALLPSHTVEDVARLGPYTCSGVQR
ncbi:fimbria/pilus outer membrane usher protein [Variovorax saccharolyticus]|uniref:fimbria/pilus outer membrane usher protein n=1 Tax=Variovorax saccharolyticus TaxID=3053516 RepID=UPI00257910C2|nr:fimbria/pilus outer membrane usher protein [Variovorax sp. J31P216]MDM0030207.1 fimbria/pilus outer membrane usher protein [Variovorax sp. J31P216]